MTRAVARSDRLRAESARLQSSSETLRVTAQNLREWRLRTIPKNRGRQLSLPEGGDSSSSPDLRQLPLPAPAEVRPLEDSVAQLSRARRREAGFGFRLQAVVDNQSVSAEWTSGGMVQASEPLLLRADLVVRLGETFTFADGSSLSASLDAGATRALLTLMRASDKVESISVTMPGRDSSAR